VRRSSRPGMPRMVAHGTRFSKSPAADAEVE